MRNIDQIEFEIETRQRKGLLTEDSTIRLAFEWARRNGAFVKPRTVPQGEASRELDAVLFADFGIVVLEAKRWAGVLRSENGKVHVESSRGTQVHEDPVAKLSSITEQLRTEVSKHPRWSMFRNAWQHARIQEPPVFGAVVFGPTTEGFKELRTDGVVSTNTRGLSRALDELKSTKPRVVGTASIAWNAAAGWGQQGKLRVPGKPGFLRAHLLPWTIPFGDNCWCSLAGVESIECKGDGRITVRHYHSKKASRGECERVMFEGWFGRGKEMTELNSRRRFSWKALHR